MMTGCALVDVVSAPYAPSHFAHSQITMHLADFLLAYKELSHPPSFLGVSGEVPDASNDVDTMMPSCAPRLGECRFGSPGASVYIITLPGNYKQLDLADFLLASKAPADPVYAPVPSDIIPR